MKRAPFVHLPSIGMRIRAISIHRLLIAITVEEARNTFVPYLKYQCWHRSFLPAHSESSHGLSELCEILTRDSVVITSGDVCVLGSLICTNPGSNQLYIWWCVGCTIHNWFITYILLERDFATKKIQVCTISPVRRTAAMKGEEGRARGRVVVQRWFGVSFCRHIHSPRAELDKHIDVSHIKARRSVPVAKIVNNKKVFYKFLFKIL